MAESFNDFVAGWVSGAAGIIVGSPLDVLKARLQAPSTAATTTTTAETSPTAWQTLKRMVKYEGFGALFKGVLAPVMGLAGLNAILFVSYGGILRAFERRHQLLSSSSGAFDNTNADFEPTLGQVYLAGCGAGIASFFFSTPIELVKIQAQVSRTPKSSWQVTREIFSRSGIRGFYQGGWITIIRDAPSYGIYFWVYEGMKRLLEVDQMQNTSGFNAWKLLLAGGAAGAVSWTSIYPIDVVKSRLQMQVVPSTTSPSTIVFSAPPEQTIFYTQKHHQQQRTFHNTAASSSSSSSTRLITATSNTNTGSSSALLETQPYTSIRDCIVRSYKAEGAGVFFRGVGPTILRAFPVNAVTFYVYEVMMEMLSK